MRILRVSTVGRVARIRGNTSFKRHRPWNAHRKVVQPVLPKTVPFTVSPDIPPIEPPVEELNIHVPYTVPITL